MERPNTVAGLQAKRAELVRIQTALEGDLRRVTVDIDHLDAAIRLFDPETTPEVIRRHITQYRAKQGVLRRFVLRSLRGATEPLSSRQITEAWVADRQLRTDDDTFVVLRKRVGACLNALKAQGVVTPSGKVGEYKGWVLVR